MHRLVIALPVFFLAVEGAGFASSLQKLSLEELARQADVIVKGRVRELRTETSPDRSAVTTFATLAVDEQWKGTAASTLSIEQPGGSAGAIAQKVPGTAEFAAGEKVVVFLKRRAASRYVVVGGRQGKFSVKRDARAGDDFVEDLTGARWQTGEFVRRLQAAIGR